MFENLFRRHSLDPFLQKQAQRGEIGERQGDREFRIRVKTCLPQSFHDLIHVLMVCGVNLANQVMAATLSAENNLQSAMRLPMAGQHLYSNFLWDAPGPPGGGKRSEERRVGKECRVRGWPGNAKKEETREHGRYICVYRW